MLCFIPTNNELVSICTCNNKYLSGFVSIAKKQHHTIGSVPELIERKVYEELISLYPELGTKSSLSDSLIQCARKTGRNFWRTRLREILRL